MQFCVDRWGYCKCIFSHSMPSFYVFPKSFVCVVLFLRECIREERVRCYTKVSYKKCVNETYPFSPPKALTKTTLMFLGWKLLKWKSFIHCNITYWSEWNAPRPEQSFQEVIKKTTLSLPWCVVLYLTTVCFPFSDLLYHHQCFLLKHF